MTAACGKNEKAIMKHVLPKVTGTLEQTLLQGKLSPLTIMTLKSADCETCRPKI